MSPDSAATGLRATLRGLYFGRSATARRFRYGLILFDLSTIAVFLASSVAQAQWWMIPLDLSLAVLLTLELAARLYAEPNPRRQFFSFFTLADVVVIGSLLLPALVENLAFLRIARAPAGSVLSPAARPPGGFAMVPEP